MNAESLGCITLFEHHCFVAIRWQKFELNSKRRSTNTEVIEIGVVIRTLIEAVAAVAADWAKTKNFIRSSGQVIILILLAAPAFPNSQQSPVAPAPARTTG